MTISSTSSLDEELEELSARLTLRAGGLIVKLGDEAAMLVSRTPDIFTRQVKIGVLFLWKNLSNAICVMSNLSYLCVLHKDKRRAWTSICKE